MKKGKGKRQRCKKNTEVKKKPHQTKKSERKEEEKKKSKIQKCLHPLYPFAELYGCLLELGPGQV